MLEILKQWVLSHTPFYKKWLQATAELEDYKHTLQQVADACPKQPCSEKCRGRIAWNILQKYLPKTEVPDA